MNSRLRLLSAAALLLAAAVASRAEDLRLGMVGLDTSHVPAFLGLFNDPANKDYLPGARVVAGFKGGSPDIPSSWTRVDGYTKTAVEKYGVKLYDSIEELARNVDAILIHSVDGRPHLDQFRRTLGARKPVFIDKPLAGSLRDGLEIRRLAREAGVKVFTSSSLRYSPDTPATRLDKVGAIASAFAFGPAETEPHHPDLFWYGIHTVEALYTVLGPGCVQVTRTHTANTDIVTGVWSDGRIGIVQGNRGSHKGYGVTVIGAKGVITGGEKFAYRLLAEQVLKFFQTGIEPVPFDTSVEILAFMEAADESKRRGGGPVTIAEVMALASK